MPKHGLGKLITISSLGIIVGLWGVLLSHFIDTSTNIVLIGFTALLGSVVSCAIYTTIPYKTNLKWARYTNSTALTKRDKAALKNRALIWLSLIQLSAIIIKIVGFTWPVWIASLASGISIGLGIGVLVFGLKNKEAVLSNKRHVLFKAES